jgi:hypothetical protein
MLCINSQAKLRLFFSLSSSSSSSSFIFMDIFLYYSLWREFECQCHSPQTPKRTGETAQPKKKKKLKGREDGHSLDTEKRRIVNLHIVQPKLHLPTTTTEKRWMHFGLRVSRETELLMMMMMMTIAQLFLFIFFQRRKSKSFACNVPKTSYYIETAIARRRKESKAKKTFQNGNNISSIWYYNTSRIFFSVLHTAHIYRIALEGGFGLCPWGGWGLFIFYFFFK